MLQHDRAILNLGYICALAAGQNTLGFKFLEGMLDEEIRRTENVPLQDIVTNVHREEQMARLALHKHIVGF